jgi:hypothetical protein
MTYEPPKILLSLAHFLKTAPDFALVPTSEVLPATKVQGYPEELSAFFSHRKGDVKNVR